VPLDVLDTDTVTLQQAGQEAALVLSVDGMLVTSNRRDFDRVAGLRMEDWHQERETSCLSCPVWKTIPLQPVFAGGETVGGPVAGELCERSLCLPPARSMPKVPRLKTAASSRVNPYSRNRVAQRRA